MQEKKNMDAAMEKYKAEMMSLYNRKRPDAPVTEFRKEVPEKKETVPDKKQYVPKAEHIHENNCGVLPETEYTCGENCVKTEEKEEFMRPPMPEIPYDSKQHDGECREECPEKDYNSGESSAAEPASEEDCKFPTAEELIKMDCGCDDEKTVHTMAQGGHGDIPDTRFDTGTEHMQGNYDLYPEEENRQEDMYGNGCGTALTGEGYIQVEVTDGSDGSPIAGAAVAVLKKMWDHDTLEVMLATDSGGMTEAFALPAAERGKGRKPYEEYMITVYKEGFFSVNMLSVPIFDTIKSIQPVEMSRIIREC